MKPILKESRVVENKDGTFTLGYYNGTSSGYEEHDIRVDAKEGALFLSEIDGEHSIYLYPEQVVLLKELLTGEKTW